MSRPLFIKVAGTWKESESVWVRKNGAWKKTQGLNVRVNGEWKGTEEACQHQWQHVSDQFYNIDNIEQSNSNYSGACAFCKRTLKCSICEKEINTTVEADQRRNYVEGTCLEPSYYDYIFIFSETPFNQVGTGMTRRCPHYHNKGQINPDNHASTIIQTTYDWEDDSTHNKITKYVNCCDKEVTTAENHRVSEWHNMGNYNHSGLCEDCQEYSIQRHNYNNGYCPTCDYYCTHEEARYKDYGNDYHEKVCTSCGLTWNYHRANSDSQGDCPYCQE